MVTGSDNINQRPFEKDTGAGVSGESKGANVSGGDVENRQSKRSKNKVFLYILYFIQGIVVGFGAILPGIKTSWCQRAATIPHILRCCF